METHGRADQIARRIQTAQQFGQVPGGRPAAQKYANEVVVDRGEHDAVMKFYYLRGDSRSLVAEVTVPLGAIAGVTA